ncbi:glutamate ABC transporter substrate-binding protein [Ligilactobacillus agilis]|uniref:Glutamate ABC transporter substrate-binding protein n=2 Tax=Ligilactobacillus agilis TaxID=1601 RepID=A0A9Q9J939_9LACO|nr:glutamate ABC transporter substrate-binding protein [Ligilactobacillus agilis]UXC63321.1 glutamate ABC transporter substrate-binding protein [Ligilactobacillus agilis]
MLDIFIAVGVLINLFFDFYVSGKLTNINLWSKRTKVLLIFLVNLVILSITNSQLIAITIELFSLYYLLKSKNIKFDYAVLGSILSTMTVSYVGSFIFDFFDLKLVTQYKSYVLLFLPLEIILYFIGYKLLKKVNLYRRLSGPDGFVIFVLICYTYIVIITLDNITYLVSQWVSIIVPILFIIQLVFAGLILEISRQIRKASVDKKTTETLLFYTKQLEESQRSLRQFKHDYQNILISMEAELKDNDNFKGLLAYSASHLEKSKAWRFNDLDNVSDPEIKSIVISKLDNCFTNSLPVSFECRQPLREIQGINKFDLLQLPLITQLKQVKTSLRRKLKSYYLILTLALNLKSEIKLLAPLIPPSFNKRG